MTFCIGYVGKLLARDTDMVNSYSCSATVEICPDTWCRKRISGLMIVTYPIVWLWNPWHSSRPSAYMHMYIIGHYIKRYGTKANIDSPFPALLALWSEWPTDRPLKRPPLFQQWWLRMPDTQIDWLEILTAGSRQPQRLILYCSSSFSSSPIYSFFRSSIGRGESVFRSQVMSAQTIQNPITGLNQY